NKNPEAMERSNFKIKKTALFVLTTIALIGYVIAAVLNFTDITSAWQMMLIYSAVVIVYAFLRQKKVHRVDSGT
ncbi:MAG: amino acid permease, partial [Oscillospiraceae bacterium]|nr:amino acid permease [Oscillospiraceae bacterium]